MHDPGSKTALLVTAREAARLLAISTRTLWSLTDEGELPACRIGRSVRYRVADLERYVAALAAPSAAGPVV